MSEHGESGYIRELLGRRERNRALNIVYPDALYGQYDEHSDAFYFTSQGGFVLTREEFEELVRLGREFYARNPDERVQAHNRERWEEMRGERKKKSPPPPKRPRKAQHGYIYLIKGGGYYKIGKAKNPRDRSETLAIQLPYPTELLHTIESDDYDRAEKHLHERYADKRTNGEWFDLDGTDVYEIMNTSSLFKAGE